MVGIPGNRITFGERDLNPDWFRSRSPATREVGGVLVRKSLVKSRSWTINRVSGKYACSGRMTRNPYKAWPGGNLRTSCRQYTRSRALQHFAVRPLHKQGKPSNQFSACSSLRVRVRPARELTRKHPELCLLPPRISGSGNRAQRSQGTAHFQLRSPGSAKCHHRTG